MQFSEAVPAQEKFFSFLGIAGFGPQFISAPVWSLLLPTFGQDKIGMHILEGAGRKNQGTAQVRADNSGQHFLYFSFHNAFASALQGRSDVSGKPAPLAVARICTDHVAWENLVHEFNLVP